MDEILVSLNKSLKFLTKYELIIISIINKYNSDKDGNLNSHQLRMLITVAQRFLFDKIFVNYLLPNLSKYPNFGSRIWPPEQIILSLQTISKAFFLDFSPLPEQVF